MMAVVVCLSGGRGVMAAQFLNRNPYPAVVALGPGDILSTIRNIEAKEHKLARVVTDSLVCLEKVTSSSSYKREVVFCGEDPDLKARGKATCLDPAASFIEIKLALEGLAHGLPRQSDDNRPSRLRRE